MYCIFYKLYYVFTRSSYTIYLKLHMLVIIFFFTKAQKQTNPWLNILATYFLLEYISLYWTTLLLSSLPPKPKNKLIPVLIFLPPSTIKPILGYPGQLAIWFVYAYIDNHLLYLFAQYYYNLLLSNFCHFL